MLRVSSIITCGLIIISGSSILYIYGDTIELVNYLFIIAIYVFIEAKYLNKKEGKVIRRFVIPLAITFEAVYVCNRVSHYPEATGNDTLIALTLVSFFIGLIILLFKFRGQAILPSILAIMIFAFPFHRIPGSLYRQYIGYEFTAHELKNIDVVYFSKISNKRIFAVGKIDGKYSVTHVFKVQSNSTYSFSETKWMVGGDGGSMAEQTPTENGWLVRLDKLYLNFSRRRDRIRSKYQD